MAIRFVAARSARRQVLARGRYCPMPPEPANDNLLPSAPAPRIPAASLRHFATHGHAAAQRAAQAARDAARRGDTSAQRDWIAICRDFAPRLAARLESGAAD